MLYSKLFGKTIKNIPSGLTSTSHKLLHQGGFIRQLSAGRYVFLPLGYRVWEKIMDIIDEEMESVGSQRINTPIFHPIEIWKSTNRDKAFGDEMHIIEDHHGATFALGATAEGLMVEMFKQFSPSYKDLPFSVHQFIGKFRDEKRPRGGLLRVREFIMKDAYSFDRTEEDALKSYQGFYDSYLRIAEKMGLKAYPVLAESGAIGGDYNHEFIVESPAGEAVAFLCDKCDYAAHSDKVMSEYKVFKEDKKEKEVKEYWDETVVTCEILAEKMGVPIHVTTKTIIFKADKQYVAAMVRGEFDIDENKLKNHLGVKELVLASEKEIMDLTGSKVGFAGPVGLPKEVKLVADLTCQDRVNFEAGGNKTGLHLYNLNYGRDVPEPEFMDIRKVNEGETCAKCKKGTLRKIKGIEWGHCFKLDQFYSKPQDGLFTDEDGVNKPVWMGSYGIGLGRSMATLVEIHHDAQGIIWPESVAPYKIHLIGLNLDDKKVQKEASDLYEKLNEAGVEVLFDDRLTASAGTKFADADLIGCPFRAVVSRKTAGMVEFKKRSEKDHKMVSTQELIALLSA
ncbi:proline--tRNA ligase [Patescibacteria group bacterium]